MMRSIAPGFAVAIGLVLQLISSPSIAADSSARIYHQEVKLHPLGEHHESAKKLQTVKGAQAILVITSEGAFVSLSTRQLTPGNVYSAWIGIFNKPENCKASPCNIEDFTARNAMTQSDMGYVDGSIAAADGTAHFLAYIPKGQLKQNWYGTGFQNLKTGEIHLAVHDHGSPLPGLTRMMMESYRGGCKTESLFKGFPESSKSDGQPGPNDCNLLQIVFFVRHPE